MSITYFKDAKDSSRSYYRITRAINGIEKQEYVRIKNPTEKGKAAALKKAKAIDEKLANWQRSIRALKNLKGENLVLPNGKVIGLQLQYRKRIENRIDIEFKLRVKLPETPPYYRSVSIKRWGLEGAFKKAIHIICELKNIETRGERYQMMMDCLPNYYEDYYLNPDCPEKMPESLPRQAEQPARDTVEHQEHITETEYVPSLISDIQKFLSKKKEKIISGR
jgi:hypothetical protein